MNNLKGLFFFFTHLLVVSPQQVIFVQAMIMSGLCTVACRAFSWTLSEMGGPRRRYYIYKYNALWVRQWKCKFWKFVTETNYYMLIFHWKFFFSFVSGKLLHAFFSLKFFLFFCKWCLIAKIFTLFKSLILFLSAALHYEIGL